jgi:Domain of unknown function (DUF4124)
MTFPAALLSVFAIFATPAAEAQSLFKCVQDGKTVYQAQPCPEAARQDTLRVQAASPAASSPDIDRMIEFMSAYRACADGIMIWREEMAGPYETWRKRNAVMVSRIENDKELRTRYEQRTDAKRNGKAGMCRDVALELRGVKR